MKTRTTRKAMYENYSKENVFYFGYCDIYYIGLLFDYKLYTCGVYGWNADVLPFQNFALCTGYRPFGVINKKVESICKEINERIKADKEYYLHTEDYIKEISRRINEVIC